MNKFKKGDNVIVISGKDRGKSGIIEKVFPEKNEILIENINVIKRHMKPTQDSKGGIIEKASPLPWSKVKAICSKTQKPTRVRFVLKNDKKVREAKVSGKVLE